MINDILMSHDSVFFCEINYTTEHIKKLTSEIKDTKT